MTFLYPALNFSEPEIRVLKLAPAQEKSHDIICSLTIVSLADNVEYEALSYVWGMEPPSHQIYLNGHAFPVRSNLHMALQRLRSMSQVRCLWIDAICIDQLNIEERNHQVARMRDIYARALRVLIWLGSSDAEIEEVIEAFSREDFDSREIPVGLIIESSRTFVESVPVKMYEFGHSDGIGESALEDTFPYKESVQKRSVTGFTSCGLKKILDKPWWSRVWVVQEFIVARTPPLACIGERWVSWDVIFRILVFVTTKRIVYDDSAFKDMPASRLLNIGFICQDWATAACPITKQNVSLEQYLAQTSERDATDPRDKIFALIGLVSEARGRFMIDYAMPTNGVFQNAMVEVFQSSRDLTILQFASDEKEDRDLPSWCVDFSSRNWFNANKQTGSTFESLHGFVSHDSVRGSLTVRGRVFARILHLQNYASEGKNPVSSYNTGTSSHAGAYNFRSKLLTFRDKASVALLIRLTPDQAAETMADGALWETWCEGLDFTTAMNMLKAGSSFVTRNECMSADLPRRWSDLEQAMHLPFWSSDSTKRRTLDEPLSEGDEALVCMMNALSDISSDASCSLLTTDTGSMAKVPKALNPTDVLCTIFNCSKVAALRPNPDEKTHTLLGFAYVHGFDYREWAVWDGREDSQEFVLL